MKATIRQKNIIAENTLNVIFDLGGQPLTFQPGQFFFLELINPPYQDDRGPRRHFSFVSSPEQKNIIEMATRLSDSAFKRSLAELPLGAAVEIGPVSGEFILPAPSGRPLVFIAGGIGITPFISMLRLVAEKKLDYEITLLYFNRNRAATAFYRELFGYKKILPGLEVIFSMDSDSDWPGEKKQLSPSLVKKYVPGYRNAAYLMAGPPAMTTGGLKVLQNLKIKPENIKSETFTGYK